MSHTPGHDPLVHTHLSSYLQRICDHVRLGYRHWCSGTIRVDKAAALVRKFDRLYAVGRSRHQRAWARHKGEAAAVLLLYAPTVPGTADTAEADDDALLWTLLLTPGQSLAQQLEVLHDAGTATGRVQVRDFELVQLPRAGQAHSAWTWRLSEGAYQGWRAHLIDTARRSPWLLPGQVQRLARTPGFAGCRVQVKKLQQLARAEHQRRMPGQAVLALPRVLYVQRLASGQLRLSQLRRRYTAQTSCAANTRGDRTCH
ncbi:hypothetical protein HND92_04050 [Diaphorobacter sp. JS3050]|uniref:hypothetical protein n=1 Tax=Diaphorobacter TaxID=238749 RepID=UPI0000DCB8B6|nr:MULTISPECIES: hypothetical protein [unclassified Diaphorobacter]ABM40814.1 hypothetical protein Ajs_0564 [Acidovorax sp. JS42]QJY32244.1 hypothetical protein HND92_04050 [Diaphorobacter sp. JS3050]QPN32902.1 hypothetical protein I3K84_10195 [Diaphorobacter sp. JS3051]QYY26179.1 hypothetical protein K2L43_03050 [Diaphorobacter sp. MNS-0]